MRTEKLEARINGWKWGLVGFAMCLISAYFWYFGFRLEQPAAENADKWGQFGDFVGGLLNPMVAFAAFYWLTQSVKIQKIELAETRAALQLSADAQKEQAKSAEMNVRLLAVTAITNTLNSRASEAREKIKAIRVAAPKDAMFQELYFRNHALEIEALKSMETDAMKSRDKYLEFAKEIFDEQARPKS